jgi:hypothetical protein
MEFPAFRRYESTRQHANNAMMALLAGSELAVHTLQLTTGSSRLLPEIFPGIDHIAYFNLKTADAVDLLTNVGHHLGSVAVTYALAVHEDFIRNVLDMLSNPKNHVQASNMHEENKGGDQSTDCLPKNHVQASNMHETVWSTLGQPLPPSGSCVSLEHFHLLRRMRNTHIHNGGVISPGLKGIPYSMSMPAAKEWRRLSHRTPEEVLQTGQLQFTIFDIFLAFAVTKSLGRVINNLLRDHVPVEAWSTICVDDYKEVSSKLVGSDRWLRGLLGHAAMHYAAKPLSEGDVIDAAVEAGVWTQGRDWAPRRSARNTRTKRNPGTKPIPNQGQEQAD